MKTVHEVSTLTGVSVRTLHHYDAIGLLPPTQVTAAGYRLYDEAALARLQTILLFRELQFPLKEIRAILDSPDFDRARALEQQIALLTLQRRRLDELIALARETLNTGGISMDFSAFDKTELDAYAAQAKATWGDTAAYREYEQRTADQSAQAQAADTDGLMQLFAVIGQSRHLAPDSAEAQALVRELQAFITAHYYTCTPPILSGLGQMYVGDERFRASIDAAGGDGTAAFISAAIAQYIA